MSDTTKYPKLRVLPSVPEDKTSTGLRCVFTAENTSKGPKITNIADAQRAAVRSQMTVLVTHPALLEGDEPDPPAAA